MNPMNPNEEEDTSLEGAVQWLLDDLTGAGENRKEGEVDEYDSVANARKALAAYKARGTEMTAQDVQVAELKARLASAECMLNAIRIDCEEYVRTGMIRDQADFLQEIIVACEEEVGAEKPLIVICEVEGGVLQYTHPSDPRIECYTLDHDNIAAGGPDDDHGIPDEAFIACGLDPENYRKEVDEPEVPAVVEKAMEDAGVAKFSEPAKYEVWFDFGNGPQHYEYPTIGELNCFIAGVDACGLEDYSQYDTEEEADAASKKKST